MAARPGPTAFIIFGGGGDLTWRKLVPALYNLWLDGAMPQQFEVIAVDGRDISADDYPAPLRGGIHQFSRQGKSADEPWRQFSAHLSYQRANFSDAAAFTALASHLA